MVEKKRRSGQASTTSAESASESPASSTPSAAIMLNHIPEGFFERAMRDYFTQFGKVLRVRVARSKKTGRFKGYAFVLFDDAEVAQIAAEAMDGYLMFEKRMTCKRITSDRVPNCLKHGPVILTTLPQKNGSADKHARTLNKRRSRREEHELKQALVKRIQRNNAKLNKLGIDYQFNPPTLPTLESLKNKRNSTEVTDVKKDEKEEVEIKDEVLSGDEGGSDGDTTFALDDSKFSMVDDSSDDEIIFKTPPNTIRKSKRAYSKSGAEDSPTVSSASSRKSSESSQSKTTKPPTPKSSAKKQKQDKISKIPTLKKKNAGRSVGAK